MADGGNQNRGGEEGADLQFATELVVTLAGETLSSEEGGEEGEGDTADLISVVVEQDLDQPDMAQVTLANADFGYSSSVKIGDELKVEFGKVGGERQEVFLGRIVGIEPKYSSEAESQVTVRAFDALHQLVRGRNSRAWQEDGGEVPERTILENVLGLGAGKAKDPSPGNTNSYGLKLDTDIDAMVTHAYQHNQTDLEFLLHRAKMYGARIRLAEDNETVIVKKPDYNRDDSGITLELKPGAPYELKQFSPRMSATEVLDEVEVRGWDPIKKEEIVKSVKAANSVLGDFVGNKALESFGKKKSFSVDSPVFSPEEAEAKAQSLLNDALMDFITGTGVVIGQSALAAGQVVTVSLKYGEDSSSSDDGYRFNGKYLLTGVTHRYTREKSGNYGGYLSLIRFSRDAAQSGGGG